MSVVYRNLDGEEISFEECVLLMEDDATRRVARTVLRNGRIVSTVWLGLAMPGPEAAFETMVFPAAGDFEEVDMCRYPTKALALEGHERLVRKWSEVEA